MMSTLAQEISDLAVRAGAPDADLTILAEGNAAVLDRENDRFLVKASGVVMGDATAEDWVWVSLSKSVEILDDAHKNGRHLARTRRHAGILVLRARSRPGRTAEEATSAGQALSRSVLALLGQRCFLCVCRRL